jgi:hypothetical protein
VLPSKANSDGIQTGKVNEMSDQTHTTTDGPGDARDERGRFGKGNRGGPGNASIDRVAARRRSFDRAVKSADIRLAVQTIRSVMLGGGKAASDTPRLAAARELLNRTLGTPPSDRLIESVTALQNEVAAIREAMSK